MDDAKRPAEETPLQAAKRARLEAEQAAAGAKRRQRELEHELDAAAVREAWGKARPWCEAHGLADFYAWADPQGVVYERAHADDSTGWYIYTHGCDLQMNCGFGTLAALRVGPTCVSVYCADRTSPTKVRIDGQTILRGSRVTPGPVDLSADAAGLLARASVLQLVHLMVRMAFIPFDPRRGDRSFLDPVDRLAFKIPLLNNRCGLGSRFYQQVLDELVADFEAELSARDAGKE